MVVSTLPVSATTSVSSSSSAGGCCRCRSQAGCPQQLRQQSPLLGIVPAIGAQPSRANRGCCNGFDYEFVDRSYFTAEAGAQLAFERRPLGGGFLGQLTRTGSAFERRSLRVVWTFVHAQPHGPPP